MRSGRAGAVIWGCVDEAGPATNGREQLAPSAVRRHQFLPSAQQVEMHCRGALCPQFYLFDNSKSWVWFISQLGGTVGDALVSFGCISVYACAG